MVQVNTTPASSPAPSPQYAKPGAITRSIEAGLISPYHPIVAYEKRYETRPLKISFISKGGDSTSIVSFNNMMVNLFDDDLFSETPDIQEGNSQFTSKENL